jgi:PAS domain S-box-containing protein
MRHPGNRGTPLKTYLMQLYWLCVLPLLLLAAWLAYDNVQGMRIAQDQQATNLARNFATAVDQQLQAHTNALTIIAQSSHIDAPDEWPQLYQEALGVQRSLGMHLALVEGAPPRRLIFNTQVPYGAPLPPTPRSNGFQALPAALVTLKPAVGDVLTNPFNQRLIVAIVVPVVRDGQARFAVASPVDIGQFQQMLTQFSLPAGWAMSLRDGTGRLMARAAPAGFDTAMETGSPGQFEVKSALSRWTVKLEIPSAARESPLVAAGTLLGILVVAATLAGALGGMSGSRRLGQAVSSLTRPVPTSELDIAEIRDAQALLDETAQQRRHSEARFRRLFQDAPIGMRLADLKGNVLAQNARFDEMFGYSIQDVPTLRVWMERAYPDLAEREKVNASWNRASSLVRAGKGQIYEGEYRITDKQRQVHVVQVRGSVLADGMLSTFVDVTEQRKTENSLRLWAEAFEHAEMNLAIADPASNTVLSANPAFARARGYEPEEMVGMPVARLLPPEYLERIQNDMANRRDQSHVVFKGEHVRKDGSRFPVLAEITVLLDAQGEPVTRLIHAIDLTERERAEAEIQALHATLERRVLDRTAKLSQANQELDSFAYTVSHDLRAPLRAMDGYLHMFREDHGAGLSPDAHRCLDQIAVAAERMTSLIDGILTMSREVNHEIERAPVDLSALALRRLDELAGADPARDVSSEVQPGLMTTGDPRMLDVLITNLVDNAWKYTTKAAAPHIQFSSNVQDGRTWFCLSDNGAGFDPAHAKSLFQPFQRMHRQDEFPGIGIGLATVHRIVQRHHGQIVAEASPGHGATFRFTLEAGTNAH